jgi:hypothetical protein
MKTFHLPLLLSLFLAAAMPVATAGCGKRDEPIRVPPPKAAGLQSKSTPTDAQPPVKVDSSMDRSIVITRIKAARVIRL